jgi:hypothetical protein
MVVASLLHYLHGRSRLFASIGIVVVLLCALFLLAYAVFAAGLTSDHSPDGPLMGPFRWWTATNLA